MKKFMLLSVLSVTLLMTSSCEKVKDALFKPFESPLSFDITIPVITSTTAEVNMGETVVRYNLDSIIKKNTGEVFGSDIVGAMYINEIGIQLMDNDANNNLGNFEYVKLSVSSGNTPATFGPFTMPETANSSATFSVSNGANIKPYFSGSNVYFEMDGKANTATTKALRARVSATIRFEK